MVSDCLGLENRTYCIYCGYYEAMPDGQAWCNLHSQFIKRHRTKENPVACRDFKEAKR